MSPIAVIAEKVVSDAPLLGQGETAAKPRPDASANRINDTEAATTAPAMIAAHETAEVADSTVGAPVPVTGVGRSFAYVSMVISLMPLQRQTKASRMMMGIGTPNSHSRIPRPMISPFDRQTMWRLC
jgi:hypothetical protein